MTQKHLKKSIRASVLLIAAQIIGSCFVLGSFAIPTSSYADSSALQGQIDSDTSQIASLTQEIAQYKQELSAVGANKKTLQNAIKTLDLQRSEVQTQLAVTQNQIQATQLQLQQLDIQIASTNQSISSSQNELSTYLQDIQQTESQPLLFELLTSNSLSDFWQHLDETVQVQAAIQKKTQDLQTEESTLASTQQTVQQKQDSLSAQNTALASQQQSLNATVSSKNQLLAQTNNKESTYQKLLAQAQTELNSFSNFTKNAGGTKLLANQTVCDSWGCYYNQRDTSWGADPLDGTNYSMASDGCLVTAVAMVMTHYGYGSVTPATINSNPNNFAAYYPAYLLTTVSADGVSASRVSSTIDATLASGNPVIIGMHVYGGTHFVVLISGSNGNYVMRDPYVANGKDINFSSYYSLREIYSIAKVVIS